MKPRNYSSEGIVLATKRYSEGDRILVIFTKDYGSLKNQQIIDEVYSFKPVKLQNDFSQAQLEGTDEIVVTMDASLLDHPEIIDKYVDKTEVPKHLNKKTIKIMMEKLKEEEVV